MAINETLAHLWITLSHIPVVKAWSIFETYEGFLNFWHDFGPEMEKVLGIKLYKQLLSCKNYEFLQDELIKLQKKSIEYICYNDSDYPAQLKQIPCPPLALFVKGNKTLLKSAYNIAMVGTRHPSYYGSDSCGKIAQMLSRAGITITSGFATGIDAAAHQGAIKEKGKTIAVLGNGLDVDYPKSNFHLRKKLEEAGGLFVTEYPLGTQPLGYHFPARNRIISGLSEGMVFVEGKIKSGGMVTVRHALDQGKEVFALPGEVGKTGSEGPHLILREGARLITGGEDIIEDMGWEDLLLANKKAISKPNETLISTLPEVQQKILMCLVKEDCSFEQLVNNIKIDVDILGINLTFMEIEGIIKKSPGNVYHYIAG